MSSDNNFNLGKNLGGGGVVSTDEMECSDSFTVESHDLSERLGNAHLETLVKEISKSLSIFAEVTSDETLIGGIEEWVEGVLLAYLGDFFPLVHSWINTSWIVSTSME